MLGISENLITNHGLEVGSLALERWAGDTGLWFKVKELRLLRVEEDLLLLGIILC